MSVNLKLLYRPEESKWRLVKMPPEPTLKDFKRTLGQASVSLEFAKHYYNKEVQHAISEAILIAPQDQEKVALKLFESQKFYNDPQYSPYERFKDWKPSPSKLYDSGDLEFELKEFVYCLGEENWIEYCDNYKKEGCGCQTNQFFVLKHNIESKTVCAKCGGKGCWTYYSTNEKVICDCQSKVEEKTKQKIMEQYESECICEGECQHIVNAKCRVEEKAKEEKLYTREQMKEIWNAGVSYASSYDAGYPRKEDDFQNAIKNI